MGRQLLSGKKDSKRVGSMVCSSYRQLRLRVWEEDGRAVGYATLSPYREKEAYLGTVELSVYVHREYQGRGIGTELIKEILRIARENPAVHTVVSVITGSNDRSRKLHEQLGFVYCGKSQGGRI